MENNQKKQQKLNNRKYLAGKINPYPHLVDISCKISQRANTADTENGHQACTCVDQVPISAGKGEEFKVLVRQQ